MAIIKAGAEPLVELAAFLAPFGEWVRRSESKCPLERYPTGLLSDVSRQTTAGPGRALPGGNGQCLPEFLTRTEWKPGETDRLRIAHMLKHASVGGGVLFIDDTGLLKKGNHSVGVARQYSGTLRRLVNCQVLLTAHYPDAVFDWPVAGRPYLPEHWTGDGAMRASAQLPETVGFQTTGEIALALIDDARQAGEPPPSGLRCRLWPPAARAARCGPTRKAREFPPGRGRGSRPGRSAHPKLWQPGAAQQTPSLISARTKDYRFDRKRVTRFI